jgi:hypothetical protein
MRLGGFEDGCRGSYDSDRGSSQGHAAYMAKEPPYSTAEQIELIVRMEAAIDRLAPRSSRYVKEAESFRRDQPRPRGVRLAGVLQALKEDVNAGWLKTVEELSGLPEVLHVTACLKFCM